MSSFFLPGRPALRTHRYRCARLTKCPQLSNRSGLLLILTSPVWGQSPWTLGYVRCLPALTQDCLNDSVCFYITQGGDRWATSWFVSISPVFQWLGESPRPTGCDWVGGLWMAWTSWVRKGVNLDKESSIRLWDDTARRPALPSHRSQLLHRWQQS